VKKLFLVFTVLIIGVLALSAPQHLVIFHINDTHGHVWSTSDGGGFAKIATLVNDARKEIEAEGGKVLFLHAGDVNTGVPESDQLDAVPDFSTLHYMGVDAMALGNHEFDIPLDVLKMQERVAGFPFLSANFVDRNVYPVFKPYIIKDLNGLKVGIIGVTTEQTTQLEPIYLGENKFESALEAVKDYLPEVKEKSDVVIVLGHLGYKEYPVLPVGYTTSDELASKVDGITAIIDGHTHSLITNGDIINNTVIAQAGEWGKNLGRVDLWIENGRLIDWKAQVIPVTADVPSDPFIDMVAQSYYEMGSSELNKIVGKTEVLLDGERADVRSKETNLGYLITDSLVWKTGADFALTNGGGIRASIKAGDITYRDVLTVLPFGNTLYVLNITGEKIMEMLKYAATIPAGQGAFPHVSGLSFSIDKNGNPEYVLIKGYPVVLNKTYKMVTNNYVALGGDGYTMLSGLSGYDTGFVMADIVKDYIGSLGTITDYSKRARIIR